MIIRRLLRLAMVGLATPAATADVVDDLGVPERQFVITSSYFGGQETARTRWNLLGMELSEKHAVAIETELKRAPDGSLAGFLEMRGDYSRALELGESLPLLDWVRLLLRAGKTDEAKALMSGEEVRKGLGSNAPYYLAEACQPLEIAEDWENLRMFLGLLSKHLNSPGWRLALWSEELDLAWHLDKVDALLEESADDPVKLAVLHDRLGNMDQRDGIVSGLLENAEPDRVVELLGLVQDCQLVVIAGKRMWNREDLAVEDRKRLFSMLYERDFDTTFRVWLANGGDAVPLADVIWQVWASQRDLKKHAPVLEALIHTYPDEARFQFLIGQLLSVTDPGRAAEFFEKAANHEFSPNPPSATELWRAQNSGEYSEEFSAFLTGMALDKLVLLDRQDLVRALLDRQSGWAALPLSARVRYLAAGKMDFALLELVKQADYSQPENDGLADEFGSYLGRRMSERVLPPEQAAKLVRSFDRIAAGSPEKSSDKVITSAGILLNALGDVEVDGWDEPIQRLMATIEQRDKGQSENLKKRLGSVSRQHPRLKGIFPEIKPSAVPLRENVNEAWAAQAIIAVFAPPRMRRISPRWSYQAIISGQPEGPFGRPKNSLPIEFLPGWPSGDMEIFGLRNLEQKMTAADQAGIRALMRHFGVGNPRRLLAEVLIANDLIECGDKALKEEALSSFKSLMAGKNRARGTEAFRFLSLAADPKNSDAAMAVLSEVKAQPPAARSNFYQQISMGRGSNSSAAELAERELGIPNQQENVPDEEAAKLLEDVPDDPGDQNQIAEHLLDKLTIPQNLPQYYPDTASAVKVLENAGQFESWLKNTREKLLASGMLEVDVLRRLQLIDQRRTNEGEMPVVNYPRKILALDPMDSRAAKQVASEAVNEGDRDLAMICVRAMASGSLSDLTEGDLLAFLGPESASEIESLVRRQAKGLINGGPATTAALHAYFLAASPLIAADFRNKLATQREIFASCHILIARQLIDAGDPEAALGMIARTLVVRADYPGFPYQFPPKAWKLESQVSLGSAMRALGDDLDFLHEYHLLDKLITKIEGSAAPEVLATFRMAAKPESATFEKEALPILKPLDKYRRGELVQPWIGIYAKQPGAEQLVLRLLEESVDFAEQSNDLILEVFEKVTRIPAGKTLIHRLWKRLSDIATNHENAATRENASRTMRQILREMLVSADDADWHDYWAWRLADHQPLGPFDFSRDGRVRIGFVNPSRLQQILPRLLDEMKGKIDASTAENWALAALITKDSKVIERVKSLLSPEAERAAELCDFGLGRTMALSPVVNVSRQNNGSVLLTWDFVSLSAATLEAAPPVIARCAFPLLDGKMDLQITAGSRPDRQVILKKLTSVPVSGHIELTLPPDQRFVALLATDPTNGVIRWTTPLEIKTRPGSFRSLGDEDLSRLGLERLAVNGPGGMPAWKVRFTGKEHIDLAEMPWRGSESVKFGAWVCGEGSLGLRCLDASGREITKLKLPTNGTYSLGWQLGSLQTSEYCKIPAQTTRLLLSVVGNYNINSSQDFAFSNATLEIGPPVPMPEGFEVIGHVAGMSASIALSPDQAKIAVLLESGELQVMDLTTREIISVRKPQGSKWKSGIQARVIWVASGIHARMPDGVLYRADLSQSKWERVRHLLWKVSSQSIKISGDGKWLAGWMSGYRVILASTASTTYRELATKNTSPFEFTSEGLQWMDDQGHRSLLKTADFPAGEPIEIPEPGQPKSQTPLVWGDRLQYRTEAKKPGPNFVQIPVMREDAVFAEDGTLYYVNEAECLIRGIP